MTPAQHATAAATELTGSRGRDEEQDIAALRAQAHAILATKAGTGSSYTSAESELDLAANGNAPRRIHAHRAVAFALLAS